MAHTVFDCYCGIWRPVRVTCAAVSITHHTSHITHHASRITHHASRITHHTSRITHHASHITHHTSRIPPDHCPPPTPKVPGLVLCGAMTLFTTWSMLPFACFHMFLLCNNRTTKEHVTRHFTRSAQAGLDGGCRECVTGRPPPLVDFMQEVDELGF